MFNNNDTLRVISLLKIRTCDYDGGVDILRLNLVGGFVGTTKADHLSENVSTSSPGESGASTSRIKKIKIGPTTSTVLGGGSLIID